MNAFPERSHVGRVVVQGEAGREEFHTCWIHIDSGESVVRIWADAGTEEPMRIAPLESCVIEWHVVPPPMP
jgi:hypothetical protein